MLEKMGEFFNNRIDGYEEHQLNAIVSLLRNIVPPAETGKSERLMRRTFAFW